jgi:ParB family chromosome partitioning protein
MKTQDVPIDSVVVKLSSRKDFGDIERLAESIKQVGQLQEIVCNSQMELIAGERRLMACKQLGRKTIRACIASDLDDLGRALRAQQDENTQRKDFTPSEAVAIGRRIEEAYRPTAEANQAKSPGRPRADEKGGQNLPKISDAPSHRDESKRTESVAANAVGVSRDTYRKAKAVVKAAEEEPELFQDVVKEMDETGKVDPAYQRVRDAKTAAEGKEKKKPRMTAKKLEKVLARLREVKTELDKPTLQVSVLFVRKEIEALLSELENVSV